MRLFIKHLIHNFSSGLFPETLVVWALTATFFVGCGGGGDGASLEPMNAFVHHFEATTEQSEKVLCQFEIQVIYYGSMPLDSYLRLKLTNKTQESILLDAEKDSLHLLITGDLKYKIDLQRSPVYGQSVEKGKSAQAKFRILTESIQRYAETRQIRAIDYQFGGRPYYCSAKPTEAATKS